MVALLIVAALIIIFMIAVGVLDDMPEWLSLWLNILLNIVIWLSILSIFVTVIR